MKQSTDTANHDRQQAAGKLCVQGNRSAFFSPIIKAKLTIGQPGDEHEKEADEVAEKIMRTQDDKKKQNFFFKPLIPHVQRKCAHCEEEEIQKKEAGQATEKIQESENNRVQKKCAACQDEDKGKIQRRESQGTTSPAVSSSIEQTLQSTGQKLDSSTQSFMEQRFGYDFGDVQVHNDPLAHRSAYDIQAKAYTHQNHIAFGAGMYQPHTSEGKHLLAHELTHVVQQGKGVSRSIQRAPDASDAFKLALEVAIAPRGMAIKGLLSLLDYLPGEERDSAIKTILSKIIASLEALKEPPEALKTAISVMMPLPGLKPTTLWPLMVSSMIGFFKHLDKKNGDELYSLINKAVDAQLDPMFYIGELWGMVEGIGKWFKDMYELIVLLAEMGTFMTNPPLFVYKYSEEIAKAWQAAGVAAKWISDNKDTLLSLLNDKEALMALQNIGKDLLYGLAESLGDKAAEEIIKTINEGPYAMGEAGGKIIGYFIPDIILAAGTDGISGVLKGVQGIYKSVRAAAMTIEEVAVVARSVEKVIESIKAMKIFAQGSKLGELGSKLTELLNELMKVLKGFKNSHEDLVKKIIAIATKKGMPLNEGADKMYNIVNLEKGLLHADFLKSKNFREAINILLNESHGDWKKVYQSITYTAQKSRFAEFDIIYEAIVKGKILPIPRAFKTAEEFAEFAKDMRSALGKYSADIKIQGSSTMNLGSKLKDIDIAVFANETEFMEAMKSIWAKEYGQYYKLPKTPPAASIDTASFIRFLEEAEKTGKGKTAANGVIINGEMESAFLARKNGKIFGSKLMTRPEKNIRDAWIARLGLEDIDISLIMKGKAFDVGPFISLPK